MTWPALPRLSPVALRSLLNAADGGEAIPAPDDTPPSPADSHLEHLQAANRQLRDDLAAAESRARFAEDVLRDIGITVEPGRAAWVLRIPTNCGPEVCAYLDPNEPTPTPTSGDPNAPR